MGQIYSMQVVKKGYTIGHGVEIGTLFSTFGQEGFNI